MRNDDAEMAREVNFRNMVQDVNENGVRPRTRKAARAQPGMDDAHTGSAGAPSGQGLSANTGVIQKLQTIRIPELSRCMASPSTRW